MLSKSNNVILVKTNSEVLLLVYKSMLCVYNIVVCIFKQKPSSFERQTWRHTNKICVCIYLHIFVIYICICIGYKEVNYICQITWSQETYVSQF